jgi:putative transposase
MYHVTLRGNHQQDVFFCQQDRARLDELIAEVLKRFGARLHAYCYMTNHIHALIQVGDEPLGKIILRIASRYARVTQSRLQTTGHLFERRYHAVLVDADSYFMELLRYIHLNPVAAGLARSPDGYPWSSHHSYLGTRRDDWVTTTFGLSMFASDVNRAMHAYRRFIFDAMRANDTELPVAAGNSPDPRVLGDDDFVRTLIGAAWKPKSKKSLEDLIDEACRHFNVDAVTLASTSRSAKLVSARAWIVKHAVSERIASISGVARRLNRDESSMRHALKTDVAEI